MKKTEGQKLGTVLLVESSQDDRAMYAEYLRLAGFAVVETDDTAAAIPLAVHADVVVTGVRVPGPYDGVELIRRMRADRRTREKSVIVLSASVLQPDHHRAWSAGCDAFLLKPCLPDRLREEIDRAMLLRAVPRHGAVRTRARASNRGRVA
jgi:two-component system, cell cycle response regulator DivK